MTADIAEIVQELRALADTMDLSAASEAEYLAGRLRAIADRLEAAPYDGIVKEGGESDPPPGGLNG
jgi:hypothetical protein